jgi:hypothetical protein
MAIDAINNRRHDCHNARRGNIPGFRANRYCGIARKPFNVSSNVARDQGKNTSILALLTEAGINGPARHFFMIGVSRRAARPGEHSRNTLGLLRSQAASRE